MKEGVKNKLSVVMTFVMLFMVFYTFGMPNSFVCRNHYYEAECPEAFGVQPHQNLVIDEDGNVSTDEDEEYQARQKELALERQRVKEKIDPMYDQMLSRISLWFLYIGEYSDFSYSISAGLTGVVIAALISLVLYRKKPVALLVVCCIAIPILAIIANYIASHPTFCK